MRILLSLALLLLLSCSPSPERESFTITTYNAYAFFDRYDDGSEFDGFSHSDGYDGKAYDERIRKTAILIGRNLSSSDVIILEEIESDAVLSDLLDAGLSGKDFRYYGIAAEADGALAVGFISKIKPVSTTLHRIPGHRAILGLTFYTGGSLIDVYGLHFRSRINGGDDDRKEEYSYLRSLIEEGGTLSIASGDFNSEPSVEDEAIGLFPHGYPESHSVFASSDPDDARNGVYFAPSLDRELVFTEAGTYEYEGSWYFYDMHLLSEECWDGYGWEYDRAWITATPEMKDEFGRPYPYDPSTGRGYSDHFPFTVRLVKI